MDSKPHKFLVSYKFWLRPRLISLGAVRESDKSVEGSVVVNAYTAKDALVQAKVDINQIIDAKATEEDAQPAWPNSHLRSFITKIEPLEEKG